MLILTRKKDESLRIGDDIVITCQFNVLVLDFVAVLETRGRVAPRARVLEHEQVEVVRVVVHPAKQDRDVHVL